MVIGQYSAKILTEQHIPILLGLVCTANICQHSKSSLSLTAMVFPCIIVWLWIAWESPPPTHRCGEFPQHRMLTYDGRDREMGMLQRTKLKRMVFTGLPVIDLQYILYRTYSAKATQITGNLVTDNLQ